MIISRTPFRISFFGGGTDYHAWYREHGGAVLSTSINRYCYLTCRFLPPFFKEKSRIIWSRIEGVTDHGDIVHPSVRGVLQYMGVENGVEIHHMGDLPARSGLGSSSAFTVGLLNVVYALERRMAVKKELAQEAIHIEREVLKENVGCQDQIATAYGGFNKITIQQNGDFQVTPVIAPQARLEDLQRHLLMFYTGISRNASTIAAEQIKAVPNKKAELTAMRELVDEALNMLVSGSDITEFGRLLHETWKLKRSLTVGISPDFIDEIYDTARAAGALGGKLLGAGGGGFILFFAAPEYHDAIMRTLSNLLVVPFEFETGGSQIVYYDPGTPFPRSLTHRNFHHLQDDAAKLSPLEAEHNAPQS